MSYIHQITYYYIHIISDIVISNYRNGTSNTVIEYLTCRLLPFRLSVPGLRHSDDIRVDYQHRHGIFPALRRGKKFTSVFISTSLFRKVFMLSHALMRMNKCVMRLIFIVCIIFAELPLVVAKLGSEWRSCCLRSGLFGVLLRDQAGNQRLHSHAALLRLYSSYGHRRLGNYYYYPLIVTYFEEEL